MHPLNQGSVVGVSNRPASRIDQDIERIKGFTSHIMNSTTRVTMHARSMGYFEPSSDVKASAPQPVVTTLADALAELGRAIDHHSGSLNVFD